jgi:hypothetical protein
MTAPNLDRVQALEDGRATYIGSICAEHPELKGERAVKGQHCPACRREYNRLRQTLPSEKERNRLRSRKNAFTPEAWATRRKRQSVRWRERRLTREGQAKALLRVARRGKRCNIDLEYLLGIWPSDDRCPVFGTPFLYAAPRGRKRDEAPSLDRFDSSKGYEPGNVHVISWRANRAKNNSSTEDVRRLLRWMESVLT